MWKRAGDAEGMAKQLEERRKKQRKEIKGAVTSK